MRPISQNHIQGTGEVDYQSSEDNRNMTPGPRQPRKMLRNNT